MVTEEERRRIEDWYREMAEHDRAQMIADAREEGLEIGLEEGRKKGLEEGHKEGREEGIEKMVMLLNEQGQDMQYIISTIEKMYGLNAEEAKKYISE